MRSRPRPSTRSPASSPARSPGRRSRSSSCPGPCRPRRRCSGARPRSTPRRGLLWQEGCAGTEGHPRLLQPVRGREQLPELAEGEPGVGRARGPRFRRPGRPEGDAHRLLLQRRLRPVRADLGCAVPATHQVPALHAAGLLRSVRHARPGRPAADLRPAPDRPGWRRRLPDRTPRPRKTPKPH